MLRQELFYDLTPNGLINQRIVTALYSFTELLELTTQQKEDFFRPLLLQAKKLLAVWIHYDRFRQEVERLKAEAPVYDQSKPGEHFALRYSQELWLEFDEFLVQYKSSLDYLAKLPGSLLGRQKWNPSTFGDKGKRILRLFRNVLPKSKKKMAEDFERDVFAKHRDDIEDIIDARDQFTHLLAGGISFEHFTVTAVKKDEQIIYKVPMWNSEQTLIDFMNIAFHNHLKFCEDFIVFFLGLFMRPKFGFFHAPVPSDSTQSPWHLIPEALLPVYLAKYGGAQPSKTD